MARQPGITGQLLVFFVMCEFIINMHVGCTGMRYKLTVLGEIILFLYLHICWDSSVGSVCRYPILKQKLRQNPAVYTNCALQTYQTAPFQT